MKNRVLSPREQTHLARYSKTPIRVSADDTRPVEYISGVAEFRDLAFQVSSDVLIPRIETEKLVELSLLEINEKLKSGPDEISVIEVGTGSGAVATSVLQKLIKDIDRVKFLASDVSQKALAVAKRNAYQVLGLLPQLSFLKSNLLTKVKPSQKFDLIIANLPYIPSGKLEKLDPSVRDHEPHLALDGGVDGLKLISQLLDQASDHLQPDGVILLELDETHTKKAMRKYLDTWNLEFFTDQFDRNRFVKATLR